MTDDRPRRRRGSGSLYQNECGIWGIRFYDGRGKQRRELTGLLGEKGQRAAEKLLRKRYGEIDQQKFEGDGRRLRLDDLKRLLTADHEMNGRSMKHVEASFRHLKDFFGGTRALDIARQMPGYIAERLRVDEKEKKKAAGRGTVRREIAAFRRGLSLAVRDGLLAARPHVTTIPEAEPRSGFATDEDIANILAALPADLQPLVRFLWLTGWRRSEGTNLRWANVDFAAGEVRLGAEETKNWKPRVFPMRALPELASLLKEQRARTEQIERAQSRIIPVVFHRDGEPIRCFGGAWDTACKKAGKPGLLVHDLRRSAARRMVLAGVPQPVAQKLLGHLTPSIFLRYAIVSDQDLAEGVAKLARIVQ